MSFWNDNAPLGTKVRSLMFFVVYNLTGIVHSTVSVALAPLLDFQARYRFVNHWTRATMWLLTRLNGVHVDVRGLENIPNDTAVVVMSNHQSQWETFYLQLLISPQATILKRELLWLPFFGWALALLKPIAIDRSKGTRALKTILKVGKKRLDSGISVVIYPEGTRQAPGSIGKFNSGGSMLACHANVPVLPIAHNSGDCWPARSLLRRPGKITVVIGEPIACTDKNAKALNTEVEAWIRNHYPGTLKG